MPSATRIQKASPKVWARPWIRKANRDAATRRDLDERTRFVTSWAREVQGVTQGFMYDLHRQWAMLKAARIGHQYNPFDPTKASRSQQNQSTRRRARVAVNVVHPVVQTFLSQLLKSEPSWVVMPATNELQDIEQAKVGERILDYHWRALHLKRRLTQMASAWMLETGCGFTQARWDPSGGQVVEAVDERTGQALVNPATGAPFADAQGRPLRYTMGQVCHDIVPPFEILPDPTSRTWDEMGWVMRTRMVPLSEIRRLYPTWGRHCVGEPFDPTQTIQYQFNRLTAGNTTGDFGTLQNHTSWARLSEVFIRPGHWIGELDFPDGAHVIQCQGLGQVNDLPLHDCPGYTPSEDWNPITMYSTYDVGRFWPIGVVDNLWPLQQQINRVTSNIIEAQRKVAHPKVLIPKGAGIPDGKFTSEPGEKITHTAGLAPRYLEAPQLPAFTMQILDRLHTWVDTVSNQHGPSRGEAPSNIKSGIGLALLQEQDAVDLGPITTFWEASIERMGRHTLMLAARYWEQERTVKVMGANKVVEVYRYSKGDLGAAVDVHVEAGSSLPKSKAAQQAFGEKLIQLGILHPRIPDERRKLLQIMDVGVSDPGALDVDADRKRAQWENELIREGVTVPPAQWFEDHQVHLEEHLRERKSAQVYEQTAVSPERVAMLDMHIGMHIQQMQQQAAMPTAYGMGMGGMAPPGQSQFGMAQQQGPGGNLPANGSLPGMGDVQGGQENREQTMGQSPESSSSSNPSMGA